MKHIKMEDLIVIDIETASAYPDFETMPDEWQELWDEKTTKQRPEETSASIFYPLRAGVMAEFAKIVCISIGYFIEETNLKIRVKSFYGEDEKIVLKDFVDTIVKVETASNRWSFAGHNIKEFDIPFICRRLLINSMPVPSCLDFQHMKPWETNILDTFQYWRFGDYKNYTSLKLLAKAMGVPSSKDDINGSMVGDLYWEKEPIQRADNLRRIANYCQKDVVTTANIILRFKNMPLVAWEDVLFAE